MTTILILFGLIALIGISFYIAKRQALKCPDCASQHTSKTGKKKEIERNRRALIATPIPDYDYEYRCQSCGKLFWSTIEGIYK